MGAVAAERYYDISRLLDFYGDMLSERQRLAMKLYYNDDLSLSEVAQELGISRQGVRASLKRSEDILLEMESKLRLAERFDKTLSEFKKLRVFAANALEQSRENGDKNMERFAQEIVELAEALENNIDQY